MLGIVGTNHSWAVVLTAIGTGLAVWLQARITLCSHSHNVPNLDVLDLGTDTDSFTNDLVADAYRVVYVEQQMLDIVQRRNGK